MILIRKNVCETSTNLAQVSIKTIGDYLVFDDHIEAKLHGIEYRKVSDDIRFPLAFRLSGEDTVSVKFGNQTLNSFDPVIIAGPCAAESEEQIWQTGEFLSKLGVTIFRAGCFKPRTDAYSFQGLGLTGLQITKSMCKDKKMLFVSEVTNMSNFDAVCEYADVIQVGSKCMYDVGVLRSLGQLSKPVLLKRHFGATLREFVQAADFILSNGNTNIALCERGIRTFEKDTRFSLDSCGIEWIRKHCRLPIIGDPSHALGETYGIKQLSRGLVAQGIWGLLIETHPRPEDALSDSKQQLNFEQFRNLYTNITKLKTSLKSTW